MQTGFPFVRARTIIRIQTNVLRLIASAAAQRQRQRERNIGVSGRYGCRVRNPEIQRTLAVLRCTNANNLSKIPNKPIISRGYPEDDVRSSSESLVTPKRQKIRVVLLLAYLGTAYRGSTKQESGDPLLYVSGILEKALFEAGYITETQYGRLNQIGFLASSRTDKGVSSLGTVISVKIRVSQNILEAVEDNTAYDFISDDLNAKLPSDVQVVAVKRVPKHWNPRQSCIQRTYHYYMPLYAFQPFNQQIESNELQLDEHIKQGVQAIEEQGLLSYFTTREKCVEFVKATAEARPEIDLERFQQILEGFVGSMSFHNYTDSNRVLKVSDYKKKMKKTITNQQTIDDKSDVKQQETKFREEEIESTVEVSESEHIADPEPVVLKTIKTELTSEDEALLEKYSSYITTSSLQGNERAIKILCQRLQQLDSGRKAFRQVLYRQITQVSPERVTIGNNEYIRVTLTGASFLLHQIRKMISMALAAYLGIVDQDLIKASIVSPLRFSLPLIPPEGLVLTSTFRDFNIPPKYNFEDTNIEAIKLRTFTNEKYYKHLNDISYSQETVGKWNDLRFALLWHLRNCQKDPDEVNAINLVLRINQDNYKKIQEAQQRRRADFEKNKVKTDERK